MSSFGRPTGTCRHCDEAIEKVENVGSGRKTSWRSIETCATSCWKTAGSREHLPLPVERIRRDLNDLAGL